jgi:DNA repair protein RadC
MSPYPNTPTLEQLPLINFDSTTWQRDTHKRKKQVESTFARIRQLHDELNAQLYAHPAERPQISSPEDAFQIMDYFIGMLDHEEIWVMDLDTRNRVMSLIKVTQGSVNSSIVRVSEIYRQAVLENAPGIILAHNHPSGDTSPSLEDITVTRSVFQGGKLFDIELLDHLIVSHGQFTSLKQRDLGFS